MTPSEADDATTHAESDEEGEPTPRGKMAARSSRMQIVEEEDEDEDVESILDEDKDEGDEWSA
jgi:hypothetical protein